MPTNLPPHIKAGLLSVLATGVIEDVIKYVQENCREYRLTPIYLGQIFECYAQPVDGYSKEILIDDLVKIHPDFRSNNGNQWARSDASWLGKRYHIIRTQKKGAVYSIKLDGINRDSINKFKGISQAIINALKGRKCVILDVESSKGMEIDHKNGKYDNLSNIDYATQREEDFQMMSKAANDAKRGHCKTCKETGERYDARRLGYSAAYIVGNKNSKTCVGCYWYDPPYFNSVISKNYKKPDE